MKKYWGKALMAAAVIMLLATTSHIVTDIWISYTVAFCGVLITVVYLLIAGSPKLQNKADSLILKTAVLILLSGMAFNSVLSYQIGKFQDQVLTSVKETIYSGIAQARIQQSMFEAYRAYQSAAVQADLSVSQAFLQVHSSQLSDGNTFITEEPGDSTKADFSYEILGPDEVIMTAVIYDSAGQNSEFTNSNGMTGLQEYKATLNDGGVSYERIN